MKCSNKGVFEKQNVFGMGEPNRHMLNILSGNHF